MHPNHNDDSRLAKLEVAIAHLQRDYDTLNSVVTEQAVLIDQFRSNYGRLQQQMASLQLALDQAAPRRIEDDRPPHY